MTLNGFIIFLIELIFRNLDIWFSSLFWKIKRSGNVDLQSATDLPPFYYFSHLAHLSCLHCLMDDSIIRTSNLETKGYQNFPNKIWLLFLFSSKSLLCNVVINLIAKPRLFFSILTSIDPTAMAFLSLKVSISLNTNVPLWFPPPSLMLPFLSLLPQLPSHLGWLITFSLFIFTSIGIT